MKESIEIELNNNYIREVDLVRDFLDLLIDGNSPWGMLETTTEWDYKNGFTDVLTRTTNGHLIAFEAKLTDWKRAAHQAYRNTSFAQQAYVVMPQRNAEKASIYQEFFLRYGVGLCSVTRNGVTILIEANSLVDEPILPWMRKRAHQHFDETAGCTTIASRDCQESMRAA